MPFWVKASSFVPKITRIIGSLGLLKRGFSHSLASN